MRSIFAILLIVALASQSLGFVMHGRHNLFKRSPLAPLRMAAPTDGSVCLILFAYNCFLSCFLVGVEECDQGQVVYIGY